MKALPTALVVSSANVEPLRKPVSDAPSCVMMSRSLEVNSPAPPTLKAAVAPEFTIRLAAVQLAEVLLYSADCLAKRSVPALMVVAPE